MNVQYVLVQAQRHDYPSLWATLGSIAPKIGCAAEAQQERGKRTEVDAGVRAGTTIADAQRIKELEREVNELRRANEILRTTSALFGTNGARPSTQMLKAYIDHYQDRYGVEPIYTVL